MRTLLFLLGGALLWAVIFHLARLAGTQPETRWLPAAIFGAAWFIVAAWNMWVGVTSAGYSFWEELPIFLLIFIAPLAVAVLSIYKLRG